MKLSRYITREKEMSLRTGAHADVAIPRTLLPPCGGVQVFAPNRGIVTPAASVTGSQ